MNQTTSNELIALNPTGGTSKGGTTKIRFTVETVDDLELVFRFICEIKKNNPDISVDIEAKYIQPDDIRQFLSQK